MFAIARFPTPVLNSPDFKQIYSDQFFSFFENNLLKKVEYVALPNTLFRIISNCSDPNIVKISTNEYPGEYFAHRNFLKEVEKYSAVERMRTPVSRKTILSRMRSWEGLPYVWGGNWHQGIEEMASIYPFPHILEPQARIHWTMKGLDCSGMLFEASNGATPRNTSDLVRFGIPVPIEGLTKQQIAAKCQPLDSIVWKGHIVYALDDQYTIESRGGIGVVVRPIQERLEEIMADRTPVNDYDTSPAALPRFVLRRWKD